VAKAAAVAAAVVGAGVAAHDTGLIGATPRDERPAAISSPATPSRDAAGSLSTRPAANGSTVGSGTNGGSTAPSSKPSSSGSSSSSGSGSSGAGSSSGSGTGSPSSSDPAGGDPVKSATSKLPSADDNPVTKTVKHLTNPDSGGVSVKAPEVPQVELPKVDLPKLPAPPPSVPDPGGVVSGATGAVNDATGAVTGAVNDATGAATGTVNGATGTVTGTVNGTVGGVTGGGGILGGG
jgi:hypothetical protein